MTLAAPNFYAPLLAPMAFAALLLAAPGASFPTASQAQPLACSFETAAPVAFADLAMRPGDYRGRCVRVRGLLGARYLNAHWKGHHLSMRDEHWEWNGGLGNVHAIGIYAHVRLRRAGEMLTLPEADVVGVAGVCADLHEKLAHWVSGPCHYLPGAYIGATDIRYTPKTHTRLVGDEARRRYGNLVPAPADWPHQAEVEAVAARWLRAIVTGDQETFIALHSERQDWRDPESPTIGPPEVLVRRVFDRHSSTFDGFDLADGPPWFALFVRRTPIPRYARNLLVDFHTFACACRRGDCTGLWPISASDTGNAAARPYVCVEIERLDWDGAKTTRVRTELDTRKIAEPR